MANLSFIHNLPSKLTDFYLIPPNNRYPCNWGYNRVKEEKEVYHIIQAIGGAEYLFIVTDNDYNYWGHSDKFADANKLGQEYGQPKQVKQELKPENEEKPEQRLINQFQLLNCYPQNRESLPFIFFQINSLPKPTFYCINTKGDLLVYSCGMYGWAGNDADWILEHLSYVTNLRFDERDAKSFDYPFD